MMVKIKELLSQLEIAPPESLAKGLARKIFIHELLKPRHFLIFLSLPFGVYFAAVFVLEVIANELLSASWLAVSNFSLSLDYVFSEISFINAFFPYQTFSLMLIALLVFVWSGWTIKKQLDHIVKLNHII